MRIRLSTAAIALIASLVATGAQAQDACRDYADKAVEIYQLGIANGCAMNPQLGLHADWTLHYNWCQRDPFERSDDAKKLRQRLQATCHGGGAPAQPQYQAQPARPVAPPPPRPAPMPGLSFYSLADGALCIGVRGQMVRGATMALEPCGAADQQFIADGRSGQIALAVQPNLCVISQMQSNGYERLVLDDCNYQDSWRFDNRSGQVKSDRGTCWDILRGRIENGVPVINYPCHAGQNQKFVLNDPVPVRPQPQPQQVAALSFSLLGRPDLCVDVAGGRFIDGNPVIVWRCHGQAPQRFQYDARSGRVRVAARPDMCLAINLRPTGPQEMVVQNCHYTVQQWVYDTKIGQLRAKAEGLCLDVGSRGGLGGGEKMVASRCNGNAPFQRFAMIP